MGGVGLIAFALYGRSRTSPTQTPSADTVVARKIFGCPLPFDAVASLPEPELCGTVGGHERRVHDLLRSQHCLATRSGGAVYHVPSPNRLDECERDPVASITG